MVIDCKSYGDIKKECARKALELVRKEAELIELPSTSELELSSPSCSTWKSNVSPAMKDFQFYPERRPGKGPKFVRNTIDRVYAIRSTKIIEQLRFQKENREASKKGEGGKKRKAPQKKGQKKQKQTGEEVQQPLPAIASPDASDVEEEEGKKKVQKTLTSKYYLSRIFASFKE